MNDPAAGAGDDPAKRKRVRPAPADGAFRNPRQPPPKTINALSQARNSYAIIVVVGSLLGVLGVALFVSLVWRPDHVKDILILIGSAVGYLIGSTAGARKDDR